MNSIVGPVKRTIVDIKNKIIKDLLKKQKPELDKKIDEMLKKPKVNRILVRQLGIGKSMGKKMKRVGKGLSLLKKKLFG